MAFVAHERGCLVPVLTNVGIAVSNFCVAASYTSFSILIILILSNISYRFGVGAVWLFGIERGLRALVMWLGRMTTSLLATSGLSATTQSRVVTVAVVLLIVACTMILLSEKELSSRWGVTLLGGAQPNELLLEKNRVANLCAKLTADYRLSPREAEVLQLLAQKKTVVDIEDELFISRGTAKAHVAHIYTKLDIHSRSELLEMLGVA